MADYYNEIDLKAAAWLRELMKAGLITHGEVDTRSIVDVRPDDLRGFVQCHFFAGIGGWSYALRLAHWDDARPVWTGSCPCQPFSSAGAQAGGNDPRDLWPAWYQLVRECRPPVVFGEQVESAIGHGWLDRLCDDLEREDYAVGAVGLPAACVGAFHRRQRVYFVADTRRASRRAEHVHKSWREVGRRAPAVDAVRTGARRAVGELADARGERCDVERLRVLAGSARQADLEVGRDGEVDELGDAGGRRLHARSLRDASTPTTSEGTRQCGTDDASLMGDAARGGFGIDGRASRNTGHADEPITSFWRDVEWLACRDGKARPVEPGTFPLAHGVPGRVGRLRGYGNAIVPEVAAAFIGAYMTPKP